MWPLHLYRDPPMSMAADDTLAPKEARSLRPLPQLIFASRWLQLPLYLGLIVAQCVYVVLFSRNWCISFRTP